MHVLVTRYIYAGVNLIEERDGSGAIKAEYIYAGMDNLVRAVVNGITYYVHQDIIGNVVCLTDDSGQLIEQYTYDAFGKPAVRDAGGNVLSTSKIPFLFTGREYDWETGLYQYRARDYTPDLGRFLQTDPIDFSGGDGNLYRYCRNNPLRWTDPSGLTTYIYCTRCRDHLTGPLHCMRWSDQDAEVDEFDTNEYTNATSTTQGDPYGVNGPLEPGEYHTEPYGGGDRFPAGTPAITGQGQRPGRVTTSRGTRRSRLLWHGAGNSTGCITCDRPVPNRDTIIWIEEIDCGDRCPQHE
jgi:RHS repeat-associated protein